MRKKTRRCVRKPKRCFDIKLSLPTYVSDGEGGIIHIDRYICCKCPARCPVELRIAETLPKRFRAEALRMHTLYNDYAADYNAKNKTKKALPDKPLVIDKPKNN